MYHILSTFHGFLSLTGDIGNTCIEKIEKLSSFGSNHFIDDRVVTSEHCKLHNIFIFNLIYF